MLLAILFILTYYINLTEPLHLDYILAAQDTKDPDFQSKMVESCNLMLECLETPLAKARIAGYVV